MHSLSTFKRLNDEAVQAHNQKRQSEAQHVSPEEPSEVQREKQERGVEQPAE